MSRPSVASEYVPGQPGPRFDPYVRLARSLLPRTSVVAMFGPSGELMWSTDPMTGPDLINTVDDAILSARASPESPGQLRLLEGNLPVYLCALRDEQQGLLALLAVVCRPSEAQDKHVGFNFAYSLLAPMLECVRRELLARATIDELTHTVGGLDKDLHLLLAQGAPEDAGEGANELHLLLQQTIEHLHASTGTLLVPEKGVTLVRAARGVAPDTRFLMRAHRRLLTLAQGQREVLVLNDTHSADNPEAFAYRVLCCALRSRTGRSIGVLALLRETGAEPFSERDAHIAQILARKALGVIESSYDALSGLYTRSALERRVRALHADLKEAQAQGWSTLYIDVDRLHAINEGCGMHVGDALLTQLGELIRQRLPPGAFGARLSGDRFAVVLPAQVHDAHGFAESLREGTERLAVLQGEPRLPVSISAGVAPLEATASGLAHVLAGAESACRAAKERGRNRVEVHQPSEAGNPRRGPDSGIAAQLREALDGDRLHLDAQLILPLAAAESARPHYELLLRMQDADGRSIGPDSFLAAAARYQLMPVIDRWVIRHVIEALKPRAGILEGKALGFTINFSGQSLNDDGFADMLIEAVAASGLDPELFCFEITENATVANLARAEALMRRLRRLGCGVALDDFGTGLSSLSCLRQLPVTMLKIDGSFVRDVLKDSRAESMVRAIAQLARSMSITTVAEYIETEAIGARIAELGVDYGQGFAIGRPIPLADLLTELPLPSDTQAAAVPASGDGAAAEGAGDAATVGWYAGAAR